MELFSVNCIVCNARSHPRVSHKFASVKPGQKDSIMRKYVSTTVASLIVIIATSAFLSACNTVEGAGKDVSHAGHEVSKEANEHK